jgi:pimeloyl-ACP methyl ester carboxylesterase
MSSSSPRYGVLYGDIPFACWGTGKKKMIIFAGGPGNSVPGKFILPIFYQGYAPFIDQYTIYVVTRRKGQSQGWSTRDMSNDYAEMIRHEFQGHVEVVVGESMGGMIAQHFAADHPRLFDHLVIAIAAHKVSEVGRQIDYQFAQYLSEGRSRQAMLVIAKALYPPGLTRFLYQVVFWLAGGALLGKKHNAYAQDVMVEARAELAHDSLDSLSRIRIPLLIIAGDQDIYFPKEYYEEMARLIEGSILKMYPGKGHMSTLEGKVFVKDMFDFIAGDERGAYA